MYYMYSQPYPKGSVWLTINKQPRLALPGNIPKPENSISPPPPITASPDAPPLKANPHANSNQASQLPCTSSCKKPLSTPHYSLP